MTGEDCGGLEGMNEDELVVDKQRAANHLVPEVARHQPVRGIESLGFDSRRLHQPSLTLQPASFFG